MGRRIRSVLRTGLVVWVVLWPPFREGFGDFSAPLGPSPSRAETPQSGSEAEVALQASQGRLLGRLGSLSWHKAGYRGRGVKIAILDTGFRGYRAHLGKALPAVVKVHSFRLDGDLEARDSQHGILCGEVVHTLAPEAELLFANWEPDRPEQFLEAVLWARREGARVLSCSVIMPAWSDSEGHGPVHRDLARVLGDGDGAGDLLCFTCAGNTAQRHWSGSFHDGGKGWHEWEPGRTENGVEPWGGERVSAELCWRGETYLELTVLVVLGGGLAQATSRGSIPFPGDGPEVVTVGAVDEDGQRLAYSSCGPNSSGPKPDFVAPVPFPSRWRARPFAGTSAAAPQAAGLAALLWSRHPDWTAAHVRRALREAAIDLGPPGHDCETGYGCVHLP
jgi:subtilisin family serine protease